MIQHYRIQRFKATAIIQLLCFISFIRISSHRSVSFQRDILNNILYIFTPFSSMLAVHLAYHNTHKDQKISGSIHNFPVLFSGPQCHVLEEKLVHVIDSYDGKQLGNACWNQLEIKIIVFLCLIKKPFFTLKIRIQE